MAGMDKRVGQCKNVVMAIETPRPSKIPMRRVAESFSESLEKLTRQFEEIRKIDFFGCPRIQDAQMLLRRASELRYGKSKSPPSLAVKRFAGKTWLTRPRPEIDRIGSAWLIRKFIDPKAKFIFSAEPEKYPDAIPYDMFDVEFSHHGDDCTRLKHWPNDSASRTKLP